MDGRRAGVAGARVKVPLLSLAHARSGDKGNRVNVGVIALRPEWFPLLDRHLTAERIAAHYAAVGVRQVDRYRLPNLHALNFVLHDALDGGGTLSLRTDAQGKVFSTSILRLALDVPDDEARAAGVPAPL